jgi:hypothetical protein
VAEKEPRTRFALHNSRILPDMIDQKDFDRLAPLAYQWAKSQEAFILQHGVPLALDQVADAARAGVKDPSNVRVLVVDRIPLPENKELAEASSSAPIAGRTGNCSCTSSSMSPSANAVAVLNPS